ncbi:hypothetical protein [Prevotella sp. oral taxon 376]|nr:hypothetical protein [Prevotella sp. oral taxon 376]
MRGKAVKEASPVADEAVKSMDCLSDYLFAIAEKETFRKQEGR